MVGPEDQRCRNRRKEPKGTGDARPIDLVEGRDREVPGSPDRDQASGPSRQERAGPPARRSGQKPGSIGLTRVGGNEFELVHPRGVKEMELDYEEGMELWKAGDPESARDALRYALAACHDNLWIHTALGRIALEEFRDPSLARGHFGYAVELGRRAIAPEFCGTAVARPAGESPLLRGRRGVVALPRGRWVGTRISGTCARCGIGCQRGRPDRAGTVGKEEFRNLQKDGVGHMVRLFRL